MKSHSSPRLILEEAFQSLLTTDPIYAAGATVAVDMGFWNRDFEFQKERGLGDDIPPNNG